MPTISEPSEFPPPPAPTRLTTDAVTLFGGLAQRQPATAAVLTLGRPPLTLKALADRLVALHGQLNALGIGRGDRVAVALPNGPEVAVCFVAVIATAVHVGLNPALTAAEFRSALGRIRPRALIVAAADGGAARPVAAALDIPVIELQSAHGAAAGVFDLHGAAVGPPAESGWNGPDDLALILHTSGTTDDQKLVPRKLAAVLSRANIVHYGLGPADRGLLLMPMFHGLGLMATVGPALGSGGGVICPAGYEPATFREIVRTLAPTWLMAVPPVLQSILDDAAAIRAVGCRPLRFVRAGSGRLDPALEAGIEALFDTVVLDSYGLSEVGPVCSQPLPPRPRKPGTVGVPMGSAVAVIDDAGRRLGPGQRGEVVVRGDDVFAGYLDDPAATAKAFIDGWFRTGDLGSIDADGYLVLDGRLKDMINRGGEKIAPTEVEAAIYRHPAVREACAFAVPHPRLGEEVMAAVILSDHPPASEADLLAGVREVLSPFKVPRRIFIRASFPRGAAGKVRRAELSALCLAALESDASQKRPLAAHEAALAELWRDVLGLDAIDPEQDFFLAGGDSLKAAALIVRVNSAFGTSIELQCVFDDSNTVAAMAATIQAAQRAARGQSVV